MKCFRQGRSDTLQLLQIRSPGGYTDRLPGLRLLLKNQSYWFQLFGPGNDVGCERLEEKYVDNEFGEGCSLFHGSGSFYFFNQTSSCILFRLARPGFGGKLVAKIREAVLPLAWSNKLYRSCFVSLLHSA